MNQAKLQNLQSGLEKLMEIIENLKVLQQEFSLKMQKANGNGKTVYVKIYNYVKLINNLNSSRIKRFELEIDNARQTIKDLEQQNGKKIFLFRFHIFILN